MSNILLSNQFIKSTCKLALNEDLYPSGDITSDLINNNINKKVKMMINQRGNASGQNVGNYYACDRYNTQMTNTTSGQWGITQAADVPQGYGFKYLSLIHI